MKSKNKKDLPSISEIYRKMPLRTRLKVTAELAFIDLITELGYRENKPWGEDEEVAREKISSLAESLADNQILEFKEWKESSSKKGK
jgi:hypothetical protein